MIYKITAKSDCKGCHGTGTCYDIVDWGSESVQMQSICECVVEQLPDDFDDFCDEIDVQYNPSVDNWD